MFCAVIAVIAVIAWPPSMVTVLMSAWMPAPPPESEPAMIEDAREVFRSAHRVQHGRLRVDRRNAFKPAATASQMSSTSRSTIAASSPSAITRISGSVPDLRITSRPRPPSSRLGRRRSRALTAIRLERRAAVEADVLEQLRHRLEQVQQLARRLARLDQRGEHLQPRDQPVAGRRMVGKDDVARLLAADIAALRAHRLEHIAVADLGAHAASRPCSPRQRSSPRLDMTVATIAAAAQRRRAAASDERDQRHQLVAVDQSRPSRRPRSAGRRRRRARGRYRRPIATTVSLQHLRVRSSRSRR